MIISNKQQYILSPVLWILISSIKYVQCVSWVYMKLWVYQIKYRFNLPHHAGSGVTSCSTHFSPSQERNGVVGESVITVWCQSPCCTWYDAKPIDGECSFFHELFGSWLCWQLATALRARWFSSIKQTHRGFSSLPFFFSSRAFVSNSNVMRRHRGIFGTEWPWAPARSCGLHWWWGSLVTSEERRQEYEILDNTKENE